MTFRDPSWPVAPAWGTGRASICSRSPQPEDRRAIEVKGRARGGDIELSEHEWAKACNLRDGYWLYAVYDCATPWPRLVRVRDPFAKLLAKSRVFSAYAISAASVQAAAEGNQGSERQWFSRRDAQTRRGNRGTFERTLNMGATHVTVTIRNPADPDRAWEGLFLIDTGAIDSLVPRPHLESIGLQPRGRRVYELADGREITMEVTVGEIEFMGETVGGTILFGDADAEPLLGVTALESVGIEVDPNNQRLKRRPAVRLKSLREPDAPIAAPPDACRPR